jgi:hypothetical protein
MLLLRKVLLVSVRLYTWLLVIYPVSFRREYGNEMVMLFRDMSYAAIGNNTGYRGLLSLWFLVLPELWTTAREQHLLAGCYERFQRIRNRLLQAAVSLIVMVLGCIYLLYVRA